MKYISFFAVIIVVSVAGCVGEKPLSEIEATDEEAIYNVMFIDNYRLTTLDLISSDVPDTLEFIANPDPENPLYWHIVEGIDEDFQVDISNDLVDSPVGLIYSASVSYDKTYSGTFEILRYNEDTDTSNIERYSKEFVLKGTRDAECQQWGLSNQVRRGWLLTSIGDARFFTPEGGYHFLDDFYYNSSTDSMLDFTYGTYSLEDLVHFEPGEEVTVHYQLTDNNDLLLMYVPVNDFGYQMAVPQPDSPEGFKVVFNMPGKKIYGQLRFLIINAGAFYDDYRASGYSYNYSTR